MAFSVNVSPQDVLIRRSELKQQGWSRLHAMFYEARRVVLGDIFSASLKRDLRSEDKPALTYNLAKMYMKAATGTQRQGRVDDKVYPLKDGTKEVAGKLTKWLKWYSSTNHLPAVYSDAYLSMWICGFAPIENSRVVYEDPLGENQSVLGNPMQHMFDLSRMRTDFDDLNDQMKESWLSKEDLIMVFGVDRKHAEEIIRASDEFDMNDSDQITAEAVADYFGAEDEQKDFTSASIIGLQKKGRAHVIEWWYTVYEPRLHLYNTLTAGYTDVTEYPQSTVSDAMKQAEAAGMPMLLLRRTVKRIYRCAVVSATKEFLVAPAPYGPNVFPNTYGIGYQIGNLIMGEAFDIRDPMIAFSKAMSAATEMVAKTPNVGIITDSEEELDEENLTEMERMLRGRPAHVNVRGMTKPPTIVKNNDFSPALQSYLAQMQEISRNIASSPLSMMGIGTGSHQSGAHAQTMVAQGMLGSEMLRDNFLLLRKLTAEVNIRMLQHYEGPIPFRTMRIIGEDMGPEDLQFNQQVGTQILNDLSIGKYAVKVDQTAYTVTDRHAKAQDMLNIFAASGMQMPPELVFHISDDPDAEKHLEMIRRHQQEQLELSLAEAVRR